MFETYKDGNTLRKVEFQADPESERNVMDGSMIDDKQDIVKMKAEIAQLRKEQIDGEWNELKRQRLLELDSAINQIENGKTQLTTAEIDFLRDYRIKQGTLGFSPSEADRIKFVELSSIEEANKKSK